MDELELFALIKDVGIGVLALFLLWQSMRGNNKTEEALISIIADLSGNIAASTAAITKLAHDEHNTQTLVTKARRDHQSIINTLGDAEHGLGALSAKLDNVPHLTADRVRENVRSVVEEVRLKVADVALQLAALDNKLGAWQPPDDKQPEAGEHKLPAPETKDDDTKPKEA